MGVRCTWGGFQESIPTEDVTLQQEFSNYPGQYGTVEKDIEEVIVVIDGKGIMVNAGTGVSFGGTVTATTIMDEKIIFEWQEKGRSDGWRKFRLTVKPVKIELVKICIKLMYERKRGTECRLQA